MATLYDYFDQRVADIHDDDVFTLSAVRTWVFAARNGWCPQAMLRSGFSARHVTDAWLAFLYSMTLLDRHGYGKMRFAEVCYPEISDDETRVLTLFVASRAQDPKILRIASGLVSDDMAIQFAHAVGEVGDVLRVRFD